MISIHDIYEYDTVHNIEAIMNDITSNAARAIVNSIDAFEIEINSQRYLMSWIKLSEPISPVLYENYFLTSESSSAQLGFSLIFAFAFFALNAISGVSPLSMSSAK